uniref:Uncharacterized protein n=1 Tax=Calcidiscus leptoporus TaxID=127549 RepID=A0A7S0IS38_9EUKA
MTAVASATREASAGSEPEDSAEKRAAANLAMIAAERKRCRHRWPTEGTARLHLGAGTAREMLKYIRRPQNRDKRTHRLILRDPHTEAERVLGEDRLRPLLLCSDPQAVPSDSLCIDRQDWEAAQLCIPGFEALVHGAQRQLPETHVGARRLGPLHARVLNGSPAEQSAAAQTEPDLNRRRGKPADRMAIYTAVIKLSDGGVVSIRVLGHEEVDFEREAGTGLLHMSHLWHRRKHHERGVYLLIIHFGYFLDGVGTN